MEVDRIEPENNDGQSVAPEAGHAIVKRQQHTDGEEDLLSSRMSRERIIEKTKQIEGRGRSESTESACSSSSSTAESSTSTQPLTPSISDTASIDSGQEVDGDAAECINGISDDPQGACHSKSTHDAAPMDKFMSSWSSGDLDGMGSAFGALSSEYDCGDICKAHPVESTVNEEIDPFSVTSQDENDITDEDDRSDSDHSDVAGTSEAGDEANASTRALDTPTARSFDTLKQDDSASTDSELSQSQEEQTPPQQPIHSTALKEVSTGITESGGQHSKQEVIEEGASLDDTATRQDSEEPDIALATVVRDCRRLVRGNKKVLKKSDVDQEGNCSEIDNSERDSYTDDASVEVSCPPVEDSDEHNDCDTMEKSERRIVSFANVICAQNENQVVEFEGLEPREGSAQAMVHAASVASTTPLDPEEEARRREEVDAAMEILEHMRRANLVLEFGPKVDLRACVFCLREERRNAALQQLQRRKQKQPTRNPRLPPRIKKLLPKPRLKQCLICHSPVCRNHWDRDFVAQQNVILCQDCAPLFDLDNLVDCMNMPDSATDVHSDAILSQKQEQHMRQLLVLYDRALLALRHSSQAFDDNARRRIAKTNWHREGMGIGSSVSNIASGLTGMAATAVFMTPVGPWLLLTSLALGGFATAVGSGSFLVSRFCPDTLQAEQTIALASMVDSLLEATSILRHARLTGTMPALPMRKENEEKDKKKVECARKTVPPEVDDETRKYLHEDTEQQLMITIIKAKHKREYRALNPMQQLLKHVAGAKAEEKRRKKLRHKRNDSDMSHIGDLEEDGDEEEEGKQGRFAWMKRRFNHNVTKAKKKAAHAAAVAQTATALTVVGMSAGSSGHMVRKMSSRSLHDFNNDLGCKASNDEEQHTKQMLASAQGPARAGIGLFTRSFFTPGDANDGNTSECPTDKEHKSGRLEVRNKKKKRQPPLSESIANRLLMALLSGSQNRSIEEDDDGDKNSSGSSNCALSTKSKHTTKDLKLRGSRRILKVLSRTRRRVAQQGGVVDRREQMIRSESSSRMVTAMDRIFIKNARFCIKASLTLLRETARYAGGAFSAAIVCVETMELKDKVERIRRGSTDASAADKIDSLRKHLWENQGGFPDARTLESEFFAKKKNSKGSKKDIAPHWSNSYEGQRPDGSCSNLVIMECGTNTSPGLAEQSSFQGQMYTL